MADLPGRACPRAASRSFRRAGGALCALWLALCAPAGAEDAHYRLNPGDKLDIKVWQEENLQGEVTVQPDGSVSFPLVGQLPAAGKTTLEFAALLSERLGQYLPAPEVNVRLVAAEGNLVYVTGEVAHPGAFALKRPTDVMQAIGLAGGLTEFADDADIVILRRGADGAVSALPFDYGEVRRGEALESNVLLRSGDTVVVP